jgi:hypothetical protein
MNEAFTNSYVETVESLPEGIETMNETFRGCIYLRQMPAIPSTVAVLDECFIDCYRLSTLSVPCEFQSTIDNIVDTYITNVTYTHNNCSH